MSAAAARSAGSTSAGRPTEGGAARAAKQSAASTQLLTIPETAERLRCCRGTVYSLIARGELTCLDIGNGKAKTRIPESVLEQFIADRLRRAS